MAVHAGSQRSHNSVRQVSNGFSCSRVTRGGERIASSTHVGSRPATVADDEVEDDEELLEDVPSPLASSLLSSELRLLPLWTVAPDASTRGFAVRRCVSWVLPALLTPSSVTRLRRAAVWLPSFSATATALRPGNPARLCFPLEMSEDLSAGRSGTCISTRSAVCCCCSSPGPGPRQSMVLRPTRLFGRFGLWIC